MDDVLGENQLGKKTLTLGMDIPLTFHPATQRATTTFLPCCDLSLNGSASAVVASSFDPENGFMPTSDAQLQSFVQTLVHRVVKLQTGTATEVTNPATGTSVFVDTTTTST